MQKLFKGVLVTGSYIKLINKAIKSSIDPEFLLVAALQVSGLVDKEDKEAKKTEKEVNKTFKLKSAQNSIKGS